MPRAASDHLLPAGPIVVSPRRGMSRTDAALFVGVSVSLFDEMVGDGRMPKAIRINARLVWDLMDLNAAFDALKPAEPGLDNAWKGVAP